MMYPETVELGKLIRLRRELSGLSQRELSELAQMNRVSVTRIEGGTCPFPSYSIAKLAEVLGLTVAEVAQATGRSTFELRSAPIYMRDPELGTAVQLRCHVTGTIHPTWNDTAYWAEIRNMVEAA